MKIECVKERLAGAIAKAEKVTGKNLTLPILSCILLEATSNQLIVRATNLDLGIEIKLPVKSEQDGVVAVPGTVLNSFISNLHENKNIILETKADNLHVSTPHNSTVIKSYNREDFPTIPEAGSDILIKIQAKDFVRGLKSVWYSSASGSMKPELSSIYIYPDDDELVFVATDSFRLAEKRIKAKNIPDFGNILIPFKNVTEVMRVLDEVDEEISIYVTKNQISFIFKDTYLISRVIDGVFPDYKQIIPKSSTTEVTVLKQDTVSALKLANIFSDKFNKLNIKISKSSKQLELSTKNADIGENVNIVDAVIEGEDIEINFNYRYITDCFQSIEADSISMQFNGPGRPMVLRGVGDKSFLYLVMSMNR